MRELSIKFLAIGLLCAAGSAAHAVTLTDGNSGVVVNPASQAGVSDWTVDGTDHLTQQWFWYRVDNDPESSIDTLQIIGTQLSDADNDGGGNDKITTTYGGSGFEIEVAFTLKGGLIGSGDSDLGENITITNTNTNQVPMNITFFQYSNFDLKGDGTGDQSLIAASTARQIDGLTELAETVVEPTPLRGEVGFTSTTLDKLNDGVASNLNTLIAGNPFFITPGTGDATWAYQWNFVIPVGQSVIISKDKNLTTATTIPAPNAALAGLAMIGGLAVRRVRRRGGLKVA